MSATLGRAFGWYRLPLSIMVRPFSGFYAMKFEGQGRMWIALFNFMMLWISISFTNQYASIVVSQAHPLAMNSIGDLIALIAMVILFCTANWAVTSLTDGEGKFKEILMTVCYAMTPMVLLTIPAAIFSNFLAQEEVGFYFMIISLSYAWFGLLVFIGLVMVHNYTATKAVGTVLLTFVALLIIVFLFTLLFTLWQQLVVFAQSVYTEIMFRGG
jgi:hypothetical protein